MVCKKVQELLRDIYMELCFILMDLGYNEIKKANSEEYITKEILINKYEFLKNGEQYHCSLDTRSNNFKF